ncbi:BglG family transcription antiterminator [Listeria weihenstephanensis]|uniref:Ascorbate-specific PTS system EIIA component n=1 Tax=Listeria weihenstephanensis TaxID=1006155 RepID=A0A841Z6X5_9LIST|nr:BglG family transcription antiterminator [Listeria weihenstephanensis]MBC1501771.1 BglG family transcription antiterminator [Listeria weihenstephanensis]
MERGTKELLTYLLLNHHVDVAHVSKNFDQTPDMIKMRIEEINQSLKSEPILIEHQMISLTERCREYCYRLLTEKEQQLFSYYEASLRRQLIMIQLLMDGRYLSLQALADYVYVSKNTMLTDFKSIKEQLHHHQMQLEYSRKTGYAISGSEFLIRNLLGKLIRDVIKTPYGKFILDEKKLITVSEVFLLKKRLEKVEQVLQIAFTDEQLEELPYILFGIIRRAEIMNVTWSFKIEKYDIKNTREYPIIKEMFWGYDFLNETDLLYLSLQVLASNLVESALHFSDSEEIAFAVDDFTKRLENYFATEIVRKIEFKEKLMLHIRPAIYRNLLGFQINNVLTEQFIAEHTTTFRMVEKASAPFVALVGHKWSKEETVYLSMIVLGWMYQTEETEQKVFKAAVLCQSGTSISKLLLENLKVMFPTIEFRGAFAVRQLAQVEQDVDFLFTTVPIQTDVIVFVVPSILDRTSRQLLRRQVEKTIDMDSRKKTKELVAMLRDSIPSENIPHVTAQLERFFEQKELLEEPVEPMEDLRMGERNICIWEEQTDWNRLVAKAFIPLLHRGSVTQEYVAICETIFYANYQQMVIGPGIYLPHAKPQAGVQKADIQLHIMKQTLVNPEKERIQMVVALAPSEQNRHIPLLLKLNDIFLHEEKLQLILTSENRAEIAEMIERG